MKRIIKVLTATTLMVAILATSAPPAAAEAPISLSECAAGGGRVSMDFTSGDFVCVLPDSTVRQLDVFGQLSPPPIP